MRPCVFFDRDGIMNQHPGPGYVERWEDFHLLPEFVSVLQTVTRLGWPAVIISNQRGVATGRMSAATVDDMHRRARAILREQHGVDLLDVLYCPHERNTCDCRKPKPGLLLEAARRHALDLSRSWMIGDNATDVQAGLAAGCRTVIVSEEACEGAHVHVTSMRDLQSRIAEILSGR
jgi:D-glycero-D-manno-heptose 1,7-bisphosphate phosphatase